MKELNKASMTLQNSKKGIKISTTNQSINQSINQSKHICISPSVTNEPEVQRCLGLNNPQKKIGILTNNTAMTNIHMYVYQSPCHSPELYIYVL